LMPEWPQW